MEAKKDIKTGIIRHTYGTVYPAESKQSIIGSGLVQNISVNGKSIPPEELSPTDEAVFDIKFKGKNFNIISTGTRIIIVGMNEREMLKLFTAICGEEWEYDDLGNRNDFVSRNK